MKGQKLYTNFMGTGKMTQEQLDAHLQRIIESDEKTSDLNSEEKVTMRELMVALVEEMGTLNDTAQLPPDQIEGVYNLGYQAYNQGNFEEAVNFFRLLYMLDPLNDKYIFALGLALEKQKKFFEALTAYMTCTFLKPSSPPGYFRSGICFIELQEPESAYQMFKLTQKHCAEHKELAILKERAALFAQGIRKKLTGKGGLEVKKKKKKKKTGSKKEKKA